MAILCLYVYDISTAIPGNDDTIVAVIKTFCHSSPLEDEPFLSGVLPYVP